MNDLYEDCNEPKQCHGGDMSNGYPWGGLTGEEDKGIF
jgi:hypothetical protein